MRRRAAWLTALTLATTAVLGEVPHAPSALAQSSSQQELRDAKAEQARIEALLDGALADTTVERNELLDVRARLEIARRELAQVEGQLALAENALVAAEQRRDAATANLEIATRLLQEAEVDLSEEQRNFENQVVVTYKYGAAGRGQMVLTMVAHASSPNDLINSLYTLGAVIDHQDGIVDRIADLRTDRVGLQEEADRERLRAEDEKQVALDTFEFVTDLKVQTTALRDRVATEERSQVSVVNRASSEANVLAGQLEAAKRRVAKAEEAVRRERLAAVDGVLCPIDPVWFSNDWGYPRSGGRTHKGNDLFADEGTPMVAIADGTIKTVDHSNNYVPGSNRGDLGGITISYWISDNEYWYWAHMQRLAPGLKKGDRVQAGQVLGWVGKTGNAYNTPPHAHVGRYVNGSPVNPYSTLAPACGKG